MADINLLRQSLSEPRIIACDHMNPYRLCVFSTAVLFALPVSALAHVSEQGLVLLLPTKVYISAGVLAVLLTVVLLALVPAATTHRLMKPRTMTRVPSWSGIQRFTSLTALVVLLGLILIGFVGSRDPLKNPLPLVIWTFWWIGLVGVQGLIGNLWHWINPFSGLCELLSFADETRAGRQLQRFGVWPSLLLFMVFITFALAHPAPDDPDLLAMVVLIYVLVSFILMRVFGYRAWLHSGEFVSVVMLFYARMSPLRLSKQHWQIGMPGFRAYEDSDRFVGTSMAVFALALLGCGSFDGINETFWWLSTIGVNVLEFPGRSAIIGETVFGLIAANLLLVATFWFCVWFGIKLASRTGALPDIATNRVSTTRAFTELSISMLPIAFAYHLAHFLITYLVNMQYLLLAGSDPLSMGADLLALGKVYVTTGFLNTHHSVEILWLLQAGIVVIGHILSVIMAHGIAVRLFGSNRRAALSQVPLAAFMILYTFLGLWLLASPKGA